MSTIFLQKPRISLTLIGCPVYEVSQTEEQDEEDEHTESTEDAYKTFGATSEQDGEGRGRLSCTFDWSDLAGKLYRCGTVTCMIVAIRSEYISGEVTEYGPTLRMSPHSNRLGNEATNMDCECCNCSANIVASISM